MKKEIKISKELYEKLDKWMRVYCHYLATEKLLQTYVNKTIMTSSLFHRQIGKENQKEFTWQLPEYSDEVIKIYDENKLTEDEKKEIQQHNTEARVKMANILLKRIYEEFNKG